MPHHAATQLLLNTATARQLFIAGGGILSVILARVTLMLDALTDHFYVDLQPGFAKADLINMMSFAATAGYEPIDAEEWGIEELECGTIRQWLAESRWRCEPGWARSWRSSEHSPGA